MTNQSDFFPSRSPCWGFLWIKALGVAWRLAVVTSAALKCFSPHTSSAQKHIHPVCMDDMCTVLLVLEAGKDARIVNKGGPLVHE